MKKLWTGRLWFLWVIPGVFLVLFAVQDLAARPLRFRLVPLEFWDDLSKNPFSSISGGKISFYRRGESEPEFQVDAADVIEVPPGYWMFTVEAPGFVGIAAGIVNTGIEPEELGSRPVEEAAPVSTGASELDTSARSETPQGDGSNLIVPKSIYWWVVPACKVSLSALSLDRAVDQIGYFSLDFGIRTPFSIKKAGAEIQIPEGQAMLYSAKEGKFLGISPVFRCVAGETVAPPKINAPSEGRFDLLLVDSRKGRRESKQSQGLALESPSRFLTLKPLLEVSNSVETLALFRDVPLERDWKAVDILGAEAPLFALQDGPKSGEIYEFELKE